MEVFGDPRSYDELARFLLQELKDVAIFLIDLDLQITSWSPGVERLFGYGEADFVGRDVGFLFTPEDRERKVDRLEFEKAQKQGRSSDVRWHLRKDGSRIFVDGVLNAVQNREGTHIGYAKIVRDLFPDRVQQRVAAAILDETPDAISVKDHERRFAFVNSTLTQLLGRSAAEIVGHTLEDFLPESIAAPIREDDKICIDSGTARVTEEYWISVREGPRTLLSGKAPVRDLEGNTVGVVSVSKDITSRKNQEEELERLVTELSRSNEDLEQFSYVVAHDLQAPLRTIHTHTELLAQQYKEKLDETASRFIFMILRAARGMEDLIQALLRYAQAGQGSITKEPVAMNAVVAEALANLESHIAEKAAVIANSPLPAVSGDPALLLELFQNLIGNALKYSTPDVPPRIEISCGRISNEVYEFAVRDNGIGISLANFGLIFAPLKRLHGQDVPGTGIGLAVCKRIVERHGGRIWIESQPGAGSTFHFTLRAAS